MACKPVESRELDVGIIDRILTAVYPARSRDDVRADVIARRDSLAVDVAAKVERDAGFVFESGWTGAGQGAGGERCHRWTTKGALVAFGLPKNPSP
jgi:hypothetical protein